MFLSGRGQVRLAKEAYYYSYMGMSPESVRRFNEALKHSNKATPPLEEARSVIKDLGSRDTVVHAAIAIYANQIRREEPSLPLSTIFSAAKKRVLNED